MNQFKLAGIGVAVLTLVGMTAGSVHAQQPKVQQGKYITEASSRLIKLVDAANTKGYMFPLNDFAFGGGMLKKGDWVTIYNINLVGGKEYVFLAAGDGDAKDVDLRLLNEQGQEVAVDQGTEADAVVGFRPNGNGRFTVQLRLYSSQNDLPCVCLGIVMLKP